MLRIIAIVRFLFHFILFYRCWIIWEKDAKKWRKAENWRIGTNWLTPEPRYNNINKPKKKEVARCHLCLLLLTFVPPPSFDFCRAFVPPPHLHTKPTHSFLLLLRHHSPPTGDLRQPWQSAGARSIAVRFPFSFDFLLISVRFPFTKQLHTTLLQHHRSRRPLPWVSSSPLPSAAGHRRRRHFAARYSVFDPQPSPLRFF